MMSRLGILAVWALGSLAVALAGLLLLFILVQPAAAKCDGDNKCSQGCLDYSPVGGVCAQKIQGLPSCAQGGSDKCCDTCKCTFREARPPECHCKS
jgi:hypothetical protein